MANPVDFVKSAGAAKSDGEKYVKGECVVRLKGKSEPVERR